MVKQMPYYEQDNQPPWRPDWLSIVQWLGILATIVGAGALIGWLIQ